MYIPPDLKKLLITAGILAVLFLAFRYLFIRIEPAYLQNPGLTPHPIDAHVLVCRQFFDAEYVRLAKNGGYDIKQFYRLFVPLDLVFPLIYTLLFLSMLSIFRARGICRYLKWLVIVGCLFDYLENLSFLLFLKSADPWLAPVVAFFTTIKSLLFACNFILFLIAVVVGLLLLTRRKIPLTPPAAIMV